MYCLVKMAQGVVVAVPRSWHGPAEEGPSRPLNISAVCYGEHIIVKNEYEKSDSGSIGCFRWSFHSFFLVSELSFYSLGGSRSNCQHPVRQQFVVSFSPSDFYRTSNH